MPKITLTDASLRSLKAPEKGQLDFWDESLPSFGVRISSSGSKFFMLNVDNTRRSLGRFLLGVFGLAQARKEAKNLMAERRLGSTRSLMLRCCSMRMVAVPIKKHAPAH
jgi:hypothetical protein